MPDFGKLTQQYIAKKIYERVLDMLSFNSLNDSVLLLGGITIQTLGKFSCSSEGCISTSEYINFIDNKYTACSQNRIIFNNSLNFFKKDVKKKILYSQYKASFSNIENSFYQLLQLDDKDELLWIAFVDFKFSFFEYFFSPEATRTSNFFQLAFNRFLLQHTFINHHGLIIHAAGGSINGKGMVFPAVSGTGKSTLSHLLLPFSENQLFSEERIIMRRLDDGWHLWGTPWKGTGSIARNESAPLSALVFLSQAPETKITPMSTSAALRRLLETVSIPWYSQEWTDKGLAVCESLLRDIPAFELAFRPDETAVQAVADFAASLP